MLRLTAVSDGALPTRRRVPLSELPAPDATSVDLRELARRFADARLLTMSADSVEVAHEALIREWPRLRGWLEEDREGHRILRHLTQSAQSWEALGRDAGELYRGARLAAATEWAARRDIALSGLEREFLDASLRLQDEERLRNLTRLRRLCLLASGLAGLVAVAALVSGIALWQWDRANAQRERAEAATLEAGAQRDAADAAAAEAIIARLESDIPLLLNSDRSLAFLLARQAYDLQPGPRTTALLNVVLGDDPRYLGRIFPSEPGLAGYDVSPDGKYIALRNTSGLLELYDATSRALVKSVRGEPATLGASPRFVPGGESLVTVSYDSARKLGTVVVRDVPALTELRRFDFPEADGVSGGGAFAPDGRLAITVNIGSPAPPVTHGVLHLLDLHAGADEAVSGLPPLVAGVQYDPLGRYLAAQTVSPRDTLALFDAKTFQLVRTFSQQTLSFAIFGFAPDGNLFMGHFGNDPASGKVELWNPETGALLATAPKGEGMPPAFDFDSAGARVAVATGYQELGVLSVPDLKVVGSPFQLLTVNFPLPRFGPGDRTLYNNAAAYALEHWDLSGAGLVSSYTAATGPGEVGFAPDGSWFVKQSPDGHWSRWRLPGLTLIDRSTTSAGEAWLPAGTGANQIAPVVSGDGKYFATGHSDCPQLKQVTCAGSVVIWDAATGRAVGQPIRVPISESSTSLSQRSPIGLAFHPDLPLLAIHTDFNVVLVTLESGSPRARGSFVPTNTAGTIARWVAFLPSSVAPSPTIIARAGTTLSVWDVSEQVPTRLGVWETSASIRGFAVTPAGEVAFLRASGDLEFMPYTALLTGGEPVPRHVVKNVLPNGVGGTLSFAADGRKLAVLRSDGKVALWDLKQQAAVGASFAAPGTRAAFPAPDGKSLLVASDETTLLWSLDTTLWAEAACKAAGRNLTESEWAKYFPGREYHATCSRWPARPNL